ncbi:MAG: Smr/MutS family protein [Desulfobacter sp.]|nr:Smr/MutS family protein [Desulfobacter sp.]WDP85389.1 MAG: Smr/MutS family protein [Desulfobacter sp.]
MGKQEKLKKNQKKTKKKNNLPVLESDRDFLTAFLCENKSPKTRNKEKRSAPGSRVNKHGLPFIENYESRFLHDPENETPETRAEDQETQETLKENFALLLDESLKKKKISARPPKPVPLKKRLKRYPPPEMDLDLHGSTALGAEIKTKSFIHGAMHQGFFTLRIIVGRGVHSQEGPVLPQVVEDILKAMKKEKLILSYAWEQRKKNKSGALIVYLNQFND